MFCVLKNIAKNISVNVFEFFCQNNTSLRKKYDVCGVLGFGNSIKSQIHLAKFSNIVKRGKVSHATTHRKTTLFGLAMH